MQGVYSQVAVLKEQRRQVAVCLHEPRVEVQTTQTLEYLTECSVTKQAED